MSNVGCHGNIKVNQHHTTLSRNKFLETSQGFIAFAEILKKTLTWFIGAADKIRRISTPNSTLRKVDAFFL